MFDRPRIPTPTSAFASAFMAGDGDAMAALLAPDAIFHSPVTDYAGARRVAKLMRTIVQVVPAREQTSVLEGRGETIAVFTARDASLRLDGVLRVVADDEGRVASVLLWLRPLDALLEGVERMRTALAALRERSGQA
jgi:ketosteroid isomerase-like protein